MIQGKVSGCDAISRQICVALSLAVHLFILIHASPISEHFPENVIGDPSFERVKQLESMPANPATISEHCEQFRDFSDWPLSSELGNINKERPHFENVQQGLASQWYSAASLQESTSASNSLEHLLEPHPFWRAEGDLQNSKDWTLNVAYHDDMDWLHDFGGSFTPETKAGDPWYNHMDFDNFWNPAPSEAHSHSVVAGSSFSAALQSHNPSEESDTISFKNAADAEKYYVTSHVHVSPASENPEVTLRHLDGPHHLRGRYHAQREQQSIDGTNGFNLLGDHTTIETKNDRNDLFLEFQNYMRESLAENFSPGLAGSAETPSDLSSIQINHVHVSKHSSERQAYGSMVNHQSQASEKSIPFNPEHTAVRKVASRHGKEREALKADSVQKLKKHRKRKDGVWLERQSHWVAGSGGGAETSGAVSVNDPDHSGGLHPSKKLTFTEPNPRSIKPLKKPALTRAKESIAKEAIRRLEEDKEHLKTYMDGLQPISSEAPVRLLENGNFMSHESLSFLLNRETLETDEYRKKHDALVKYLRSYKTCYRPKKWGQDLTTANPDLKIDKTLSYVDNRINGFVQFTLGQKRFAGTNLGDSIKKLEEKWHDVLLESYPGGLERAWRSLSSWFECVKRSTICVLYQIELLFRLNPHTNEAQKVEKDLELRKVLEHLNELWINFPFYEHSSVQNNESNPFLSQIIIEDMKSSSDKHKHLPGYVKFARILFRAWLKGHHFWFLQEVNDIRNIGNRKDIIRFTLFDVLQDCAWAEYITMNKKYFEFNHLEYHDHLERI